MNNDIDYALIEDKRPPIYTAMKYWGKKPHNIWGQYIEKYTNGDGIFLDPFSGSAMSAFEAVKAGKQAIAFDINPLTSFIIEVVCSDFDAKIFTERVHNIIGRIEKNEEYISAFKANCPRCGSVSESFQHFKWDNGKIYEAGIICSTCSERTILSNNDSNSKELFLELENRNKISKATKWYPNDKFYESPSFSDSFLKNVGGKSFSDLWTNRNLLVLSLLFEEIENEDNQSVKMQLMFGFIQILHLSSKMCVPRNRDANRAFSTSWGRSAYICSSRQMEMNPLLLFKNNCTGKQSVQSALSNVKQYIGKIPKIIYADQVNQIPKTNFDILYGIVDITTVDKYLSENSVDFIMTDPPYGGLVQYIDLSHVWLIWLKKYDVRFTPSVNEEITIKKGIKEINDFKLRFTLGMNKLYRILKPDGKIVFTFHNKDLVVWNTFLRSISESGFRIEKVIHQQNRRTGESNVANPYGTSGTDFYIRCVKSNYVQNIKTSKEAFENFIVDRAVSIISARAEPTPYQILFNGLLTEISQSNLGLDDFDDNVKNMLSKHVGDVFQVIESDEVSGKLWWLVKCDKRKTSTVPLSKRVENTVLSILKKKREVTLDEIIAQIFISYPNGLTPDIKKIDSYIKKYAYKKGGKWIYNGN